MDSSTTDMIITGPISTHGTMADMDIPMVVMEDTDAMVATVDMDDTAMGGTEATVDMAVTAMVGTADMVVMAVTDMADTEDMVAMALWWIRTLWCLSLLRWVRVRRSASGTVWTNYLPTAAANLHRATASDLCH